MSPPSKYAESEDPNAPQFEAVFSDVVRDLTVEGIPSEISDASKWFTKVLRYNVPYGKKNRGLAVVSAYQSLVPPEKQTEEDIKIAQVLGWCVEMLQAYFLVEDDIMDQSKTRRGQPCWYMLEEVGTALAINDGMLLDLAIFQLLKKYCRNKPYYTNIVELVNDVTFKTGLGQCLDVLTANEFQKKINRLEKFTMDRYSAIVKYKTAFYSFHLPIALAMYMSGVSDADIHKQAEDILLDMGHFFQVQDDYIDCFGDPEITGKIGTDIEDGKCCWLAVTALEKASPAQRTVMEECYGFDDPKKVAAVKQLYQELGLQQIYSKYEEESYKQLTARIQKLSETTGLRPEVFTDILKKIYHRSS